jgi:hypothetical protein
LCGQGPQQVAAAMLNESQYLSNDYKRKSRAPNSLTSGFHPSHAVAWQPAPTSHSSQSDEHLTGSTDELMHVDDEVSQTGILQDVLL